MECQICGEELDPTYGLPVKINDKLFHRECFNFRRIREEKIPFEIPLKKIVLISAFTMIPVFYLFFKPLFLLFGLLLLGSTWFLLSDLPGVELTTLSTALAGINFGPTAGFLIGSLSTVPSFIVNKSWFTIFSAFGFALVGFVAGYNFVGFVLLGILGTLLYHLIVDSAFLATYGGSLWGSFFYMIIHLSFNFLAFLTYTLYVV